MPLTVVQNDITKMSVDVIVNAANTGLLMGGGVCGAIFAAAGAIELEKECARIGGCAAGEAVITSGCRLPARFIIHTVGPVWQGGGKGEAEQLHRCYVNSLSLAHKYNCGSIAFPVLSSGIFGYPKDQALQIAVTAIREFLLDHEMGVFLAAYDEDTFRLCKKLFPMGCMITA